jgi:TPR repeat protein
MYQEGHGVAKDDREAVKWYRKAAEQGNAPAQYSLGVMYEDGRGVTKDESEAVKWYRKAAEQGDADAKDALKDLGY